MYDEAAVVQPFYARLQAVVSAIDIRYEILFVDDGSRDTTAHQLTEPARRDSSISVVSFARHFGEESALAAGARPSTWSRRHHHGWRPAGSTRSHSRDAGGLGLYIVTLMCERLGWRLEVVQTGQNGTQVRIEPPLS